MKNLPDLKVALQRDHVEKLQHLLADSYAAVMELTRQMKVRERNWSCEKQELLEYLHQLQTEQPACQTSSQGNMAEVGQHLISLSHLILSHVLLSQFFWVLLLSI